MEIAPLISMGISTVAILVSVSAYAKASTAGKSLSELVRALAPAKDEPTDRIDDPYRTLDQ